jgi:predicted lysophospholipase L1 biosynthesis ABC-type transport system permease subunit
MKARMYWSYATRSLARGGQRTLLAIFCVAVGVMAIVALQLVGSMVNNGLTGNIRDGNGGDLNVRSDFNGLRPDQLSVFDDLVSKGTLTTYTAVDSQSAQSANTSGHVTLFTMKAIDTTRFPISGSPHFDNPSNGSFTSVLQGNTVVVTETLLQQLGMKVGDSLTVGCNDGRAPHVIIGGVIASANYFNGTQMFMDIHAYDVASSTSGLPISYDAVYANVPGHTDANAATAKDQIARALPLATVTTTKDALQQNQQQVGQIRTFLQIVGLLALLIGGVGIINTMQVMLRRRRLEIAMLKTTGYRYGDLYALFGLEAALLGLLGGIVGTAVGVGVSFLVKALVENAILITLPATLDPVTIASGVAIGFFTALIFGLMPIVQASRVRPMAVLRDLPEGVAFQSVALTTGLAVLLAALFFLLAFSILQNFGVALGAVAGAGIFLLLLGLFFSLVVFVISRMPVLERYRWWYLLLIAVAVALSALVTYVVPPFGVLFLAISLLGIVVVLLPRTWKSNVRLALRQLGRRRVRTATTLVALFIGVFAIGLVLVLGQDIKQLINDALGNTVKYNAYIFAGASDKPSLDSQLAGVKGIQGEVINTVSFSVPVSINDVPIGQIVQSAPTNNGGQFRLGRQELLAYLSGVQGYDLAGNSPPDVTIVKGSQDSAKGVNLGKADAGTTNVIMPDRASLVPLNLKLGDIITLASPDGQRTVKVHVVGFYDSSSVISIGAAMYSDNSVADTMSGGKLIYVYSLKMDPRQTDQTLNDLRASIPTIQTFSLSDLTLLINNLLNNLIVLLTAIASLALIAGVIIIANAVALAMLERRRELGILKSVGYTSGDVLGEVLLENGVVGFTGALLAMGLVTLALTLLGKLVFKTDLGVAAWLALAIVLATAAVCMLVSWIVAAQSTRVRPLEVLRYE